MKLFYNLKISVLSWLLHHSNQHGKDDHFYKIKNRILANYGKHICYEVQFIEGKKCLSCKGTGVFGISGRYGDFFKNTCYNSTNGWYKRPTWNILALVKFGKYEFHQPFMRVYEDPQSKCKLITGYVERHPTNLTGFAITVLFLMYEKGYPKRWYKSAGIGWRSYWWYPRNWVYNILHIIKHGRKSIPFRKDHKGVLRMRIERLFNVKPKPQILYYQFDDDLPF